jgi:hypothetical protein
MNRYSCCDRTRRALSYLISCSSLRPLAQHRYLVSRHATSAVLSSTSCLIARDHDLRLASDVPRSVLSTPRVESDAIFHEVRQRRAIVSPVGRATTVVAGPGHFILRNDFDIVAQRFERRPDARALFLGVSAFAADVALVAYAACHFGWS